MKSRRGGRAVLQAIAVRLHNAGLLKDIWPQLIEFFAEAAAEGAAAT